MPDMGVHRGRGQVVDVGTKAQWHTRVRVRAWHMVRVDAFCHNLGTAQNIAVGICWCNPSTPTVTVRGMARDRPVASTIERWF